MKNICDVKFNKEMADAKEQIKRCLKIFISNKIIQSKGYYSYFNPHPNYCENPPEKCEYFKNSKKEYEKLLENNQINEIDDKYFPFVLYMILADFKEDVMSKETGLTKNYFYHLLNLSEWIAYSQDADYYSAMINNYIINYFYFFTLYEGKQPDFYSWDNIQGGQMQTEKNHAYKGMLEIAFLRKGTLGLWLHYDYLFKNENRSKERLAKVIFGELFWTNNISEHYRNDFETLINSDIDYRKNPGIVFLLYMAIKKMDIEDITKAFGQECSDKKILLLQTLFYFFVWDLSSTWKIPFEYEFEDDMLPKQKFMYSFYKPVQDGIWYKPEVIEELLNGIGQKMSFCFDKEKFIGVDFSRLNKQNFDVVRILSSMMGALSHSEGSDSVKIQIDALKSIQERSINCVPNTKKSYLNDNQRKTVKDSCEKNKKYLEKVDVGFLLNDFSQYIDEPNIPALAITKLCKCKFLPETDSTIKISNDRDCRLKIDLTLRNRTTFYNNFSCAYLTYHRNMLTHNSYYSPIYRLFFESFCPKKFIITSLHDAKVYLSKFKGPVEALLNEADEIFKMIVNKYFPDINKDNIWENFFNDSFTDETAEIIMDTQEIDKFSRNFDIQDFSLQEIQRIVDFFNLVWNVSFLQKDPSAIYSNPTFLKKYELPIKFYEIYLTLAFLMYDGEN